MFNANDLAAELPPSRDDEPASLREDIADELADHLHCAMQRELLGGDSTKFDDVRQRVLDRFGNPAAVARQLWWDAMKEKIMAQRITAIMVSLAAAACIVGCVLVWRTLVDTREAQAALLESQREAFAALATEFKSAMESANDPYGSWRPLQVKLVSEKGEPVQGRVYASGKAIGAEGAIAETVETGSDGLADFKLMPAGEYTLNVCMNEPSTCTTLSFLLGPGRQSEHQVVCPTSEPERRAVQFEIKPPKSLADEPLFYVAQVTYKSFKHAGRSWNVGSAHEFFFLLNRSGEVLGRLSEADAQEHSRLSVGGGTAVSFVSKIDASVPLEPAGELLSYECDVLLVPYLSVQPVTGADKPYSVLENPNADWLRTTIQREHGKLICRVDESKDAFWAGVKEKLEERAARLAQDKS